MKIQLKHPNQKNNKGQVIIPGMGLILVIAVVVFMMFNSNRAVSEKINLVNAADAAAYSGALVASRQLNFMAYTNRTMIANEVAIGHMVSYQTEVNLVHDTVVNGLGGIGGGIINAVLNFFPVKPAFDVWRETMEVIGGAYVLAVDATNALYSDFQKTEYQALLASGVSSPIDSAMVGVAQQYVKRNGIQILVNDTDTLIALGVEDPELKARADNATDRTLLCSMIMFTQPGQDSGEDDDARLSNNISTGNALAEACNSGSSGAAGTIDTPYDDSGDLLAMLSVSANAATSGDWIGDRSAAGDYKTFWSFGASLSRSGSTQARWDNTNNQINWSSYDLGNTSDDGDTIQGSTGPFGLGFNVDASGKSDAVEVADSFADNPISAVVADALSGLMGVLGVCDQGVDCDALENGDYNGIQSYARLNPMNTQATITAFLTQSENCNDLLGVGNDSTQEEVEGWRDDQTRFASNCDGRSLTALSEARVFYSRPRCVDNDGDGVCEAGFVDLVAGEEELPNLFNPFWSASLTNTSSFIH
ncbi:hypothetical protein A9Q99_04350 [Gammaproteobacteria bacterium 45_16_T64]|nr:hypothetical protein A9Q99_04350 [Gammaproteobacteria bacterium 45_16_T64]